MDVSLHTIFKQGYQGSYVMSGYTKHGTDGTTNMALENPKGMSIREYFCHATIFFIFAHNLPYMYTLLHHTSLGAMQKALFSELQAFQSGWVKSHSYWLW